MSGKGAGANQAISLPKGGGAIQGIGETFSPDLHTGTGNFSVPIALPQGRNGFQPQLSLAYSTGNGNGPFGLGWALSVPGVTRKTSKGVPRYDDARDTFVLSGAEDLVPVPGAPAGAAAVPAADRGALRPDHPPPRRRGRLLGGREQGRSGQPLRHPARRRTAAGRAGPGRGRRPGRPAPRLRLAADRDDRPVRQPDRVSLRARRRSRSTARTAGTSSTSPRSATSTTATRPIRRTWSASASPTRTAPTRSPTTGPASRSGPLAAAPRSPSRPLRRPRAWSAPTASSTSTSGRPVPGRCPPNGVSLLSLVRTIGARRRPQRRTAAARVRLLRLRAGAAALRAVHGAAAAPSRTARSATRSYELVDLFGNGLPSVFQMNGAVRYWRNLGDGRFDRAAGDGRGAGRRPPRRPGRPVGRRRRRRPDRPAGHRRPARRLLPALRPRRLGPRRLRSATAGRRASTSRTRRCAWSTSTATASPTRCAPAPTSSSSSTTGRAAGTGRRSAPARGLDEFPDVSFADPRVKLADMNGDGLQDIVLVHDGRVDYWPYLGHGDVGTARHHAQQPALRRPGRRRLRARLRPEAPPARRRRRRRLRRPRLRRPGQRHGLDQPVRQRLERADHHPRHPAGHRPGRRPPRRHARHRHRRHPLDLRPRRRSGRAPTSSST